MPTYDYKCSNCGHTFEYFQSMSADKLTECPECHKNTLERLIGAGVGLIFKGTGFYLTDYKNKSSETSATSNSSAVTPNKEISSDKKDSSETNKKSDSEPGVKSGTDPKQSAKQNTGNKIEKDSSVKNNSESKKEVKKKG
ncbi:MAG TPA: zinc ribbon domain-containing protein [Ignavibacteria bacterium]|nr:zinc ribbon domain-containing protein [Ignavibacteria bacterium]